MSQTRLILILGAFLILVQITQGSRILVSSPYGTKSYHNMYVPLIKELALRGHHLTLITNYKSDELERVDNVRQIVMEKLVIDMSPYPNPFEAMLSPYLMFKSMSIGTKNMFNFPRIITETLYTDERIKELLANDKFDLVVVSITFNTGSYPLAWHFKAPMIMLTPNAIFPGVMPSLGDYEHPEYVPFFLSDYSDNMNLFQRTINTIVTNLFSYFIHQWQQPASRSIVQQVIPDCPPLEELEKNISLVFANTHPAINYPRALPPQVIEVGGIHCRPSRPLPENLKAFVSHDEGFILFAVGSMLPMEIMPNILIDSFIQVFAKLPQRVVWQWKGKVRADLPKNVLALPWLPQQDLLGHRNCRIFMTHGGLNSVQEAIYHNVPMLGLPFGTDQKLNMKRAVNGGYARQLRWTDLNEQTLTENIQQLLYNSSYSDAMLKRSKIFHDQFQTPVERAIYWTEFTIRQNGTQHLQMGSRDLRCYERALIDVYCVLFLFTILPLILMFFCFKKCCKR